MISEFQTTIMAILNRLPRAMLHHMYAPAIPYSRGLATVYHIASKERLQPLSIAVKARPPCTKLQLVLKGYELYS